MARILDIFLNRNNNKYCKAYADPKSLYDGLALEMDSAIQCLSSKIAGSVYNTGKAFQLADEDVEELLCDCITLLIEKIRAGKYVFQGNDPASFAIEVAKYKVRSFKRQIDRDATSDLPATLDFEDDEDPHFGGLHETELLEKLLQKLGEKCQKLIRLKYLDEIRDKDIIANGITQYTTVDALKNHRAQCMKKLTEIAAAERMTAA